MEVGSEVKAEPKEQREPKAKSTSPEKQATSKSQPGQEKEEKNPTKKDSPGKGKSSQLTKSSPDDAKNEKKETTSSEKPASPSKPASSSRQSDSKINTSNSTKGSSAKNSPEKSSDANHVSANGNYKTSPGKEKEDKEKSLSVSSASDARENVSTVKSKDSDSEKQKVDGQTPVEDNGKNLDTSGNESSNSNEIELPKKSSVVGAKQKNDNAVDVKTKQKNGLNNKIDESNNNTITSSNESKTDVAESDQKQGESVTSNSELRVEQTNDVKDDSINKDSNQTPTKNEKKAQTKYQLRSEIWNKMLRKSLLTYRKPCNYRIPHFKGDVISAGRLTTLEIFKNAKVVKVSMDKAHECVRLQIIEAGKDFIVGCPGLREAVFLHVKPPMEPSKKSIKLASSRIGIEHIGTALDFSSGIQADLVIVGSVAVDRTGLRVGKGEGFADLEYALLKKLGGIAPDAPIITVVHDSQVYDNLPEELFQEHDVPADFIVTPTEVIEINPRRKHPDLMWNILSNRRVNSIPIIKQLLDREKSKDQVAISLKDEDTDTEDLEQITRRKKYFMRRRSYSTSSNQYSPPMMNDNVNYTRGNGKLMVRGRRTRRLSAPPERIYQDQMMTIPFNRQNRFYRNYFMPANSFQMHSFNQQKQYWMAGNVKNGDRIRNTGWRLFRPRYRVDFSLKVQGLSNQIRVRDLKAAVTQRGIRPRDISWLPHKGMAFLHFTKPKNTVEQTPKLRDTESLLATLKDLTIKAENGPETNVKIEPAQPFRKVHFNV